VEWQHQYYLWKNEGYRDFPDCLDSWTKNMRRNVLRERRSVRDAGIETCIIHPAACPPEYLRFMADCYEDTMDRFGPWAARFLTRDFFTMLPDYMPTGCSSRLPSPRGHRNPRLSPSF
jgi:predicted N-acyltransferase